MAERLDQQSRTWPPCRPRRRTPARRSCRRSTERRWNAVAATASSRRWCSASASVTASQYLRLRGTNLPAAVPFETDADGNPLADLWTNAARVQPDAAGRHGWHAGEREPAHPVHDGRHERAGNGATYTGTAIDGCPAHLPVVNGQKYVGLRRRGLVGPVVLQQSDLHRGAGFDAGRRRRSKHVTIVYEPAGAARQRAALFLVFERKTRCPPCFDVRRRVRRRVRALATAATGCASRCCTSSCSARCCSRVDHFIASRADDPRTIVVDAAGRPAGAARCSRRRAAASPTTTSCTRCAASGSTTRCCIAKASRCSSTRATRRSASA